MDTSPCAGCGRQVNVRMAVCPFCGRRKDDAPPRPAEPGAPSAAAQQAEKLAAALAVPRAVAQRLGAAPPLSSVLGPRCPMCDRAPGALPLEVKVRVYKGTFGFFRRYRRWEVTTFRAPGVCDDCKPALRNRRLVAGALLPVPMLVGLLHPFLFALVAFFYGSYLLGGLGYSWADDLLYGRALGQTAIARTPGLSVELRTEGSARVFVGWLHVLARLVACVVVTLALAALTLALHDR